VNLKIHVRANQSADGLVLGLWPNSPPSPMNPRAPWSNDVGDKSDTNSVNAHGTCMFSRAVSSQFGVSNNAALTIVRVAKPVWGEDDGKDPNGNKLEPPSMRGINVIGAVDEAFNDILKRGLSHKAVVSMSLGDYDTNLPIPSSPGDGERYLMYTSIKRMMDYGVVVVASTGNRGDPSVSFSRSRYLCIILRVQFFQGPDYLSKVMVSTPGA
jgi:hypothetical protein